MFAHQAQQVVPVELSLSAVNNVADIGAVKALAEGDKDFGRNQLFRPQHLDRYPQHF